MTFPLPYISKKMTTVNITIGLNLQNTKSLAFVFQKISLICIPVCFILESFPMLFIVSPLSSVSVSIWLCKLSKPRPYAFLKKSFIAQIIARDPSSKSISLISYKLAFIVLSIFPLLNAPSVYSILLPVSCILISLFYLYERSFTFLFSKCPLAYV